MTILTSSIIWAIFRSSGGSMKKQAAEMTCMGTINKKVLDTLGAKKQLVGKTTLRLSPQWEDFLRQLAKISNLTIRDFLDSLATIAMRAHSKGIFTVSSTPAEGKRMSYAISKDAKETFTKLSQEYGVSRDNIVQSALAYILEEFGKKALSAEEKIKYASILDEAFGKMLDIYYSEIVSEAREMLCATGDPDFTDCEEKFAYIEQLNEVNLQDYITRKQHEIDKT